MSKKRIKIILELDVPTDGWQRFHLELIQRMNKYLAKHAVTVFRVDSEVR